MTYSKEMYHLPTPFYAGCQAAVISPAQYTAGTLNQEQVLLDTGEQVNLKLREISTF